MAVSFDEERSYAPTGTSSQKKGLLRLVQKWGIAKDDKDASIVLIVIFMLLIAIAAAVYIFATPSDAEPVPVDTSKLRQR